MLNNNLVKQGGLLVLAGALLVGLSVYFFSGPKGKAWDSETFSRLLAESAGQDVALLFGDSIFVGWKDPVVEKLLPIKWAVGGVNTRDALNGLSKAKWSRKPALCLVMIGTNDAAGYRNGPEISVEEYASNVFEILKIMVSNCDSVLHVDIPPNERSIDMASYIESGRESARKSGVTTVAHQMPPSNFTSDGIHLNGRGYEALTASIAQYVK